MIDFIGFRKFFVIISLVVLVPCVVALGIWQLEPGIDFEGGLEMEVRFLGDVSAADVEQSLADADFASVDVLSSDDATFIVRVGAPADGGAAPAPAVLEPQIAAALGDFETVESQINDDDTTLEIWFPASVSQEDIRDALGTVDLSGARIQATGDSAFKLRAQERGNGTIEDIRIDIDAALRAEIGPIFILQSAAVSGILSSEIAKDAAIAVVVAAIAIMIFISLAFRRLPNPGVYGVAAIVALLHDITIVVGVFSILGRVADVEINAFFVTGLLAIIGYSVNDTIVVFDRIRENQLNDPTARLRHTVNAAITQSLGRSLNTSITLILALMALMLIGGETVRPLVLVLLAGAIAGTYSSIAVAAQIVVLWEEGSIQRLFGQRRDESVRARLSN